MREMRYIYLIDEHDEGIRSRLLFKQTMTTLKSLACHRGIYCSWNKQQ